MASTITHRVAAGAGERPAATTATSPPRFGKYIPALDGVRGVAILLVFTYHAIRELPAVRWHEQIVIRIVNTGWIGVDLFFVLSGFLITGILLDAKGGRTYFRSFYARRVLRIFPLYFAFVTFVIWIAPALRLTTLAEAAQLRHSQGWYWSYLVNVMIARHDWGSAIWNTGHLWSLSVEEQFYLLWPALVFLCSRRTLIRLTIGIILGVAALRVGLVATHAFATGIYVLLPTRMDSLATGALLAALAREPGAWDALRRWTLPVGIAMTLALLAIIYRMGLLYSERPLTETIGYPALAILSAVTIVSATSVPAGSRRYRFWTNPVLRFFGRYSYGVYIWHHIVIPLLRQYVFPDRALLAIHGSHLPGYLLFWMLALAVSVGVELVSWHFIEMPFLRLKRFVPYH